MDPVVDSEIMADDMNASDHETEDAIVDDVAAVPEAATKTVGKGKGKKKKSNSGAASGTSEPADNDENTDNTTTAKAAPFRWTDMMRQDLFDIILESNLLKRALLLENMGQATAQYYETVSVAL